MEALQQHLGLQQPPLLPTNNHHNTFSQLYSDQTLDPCHGQYAHIMHQFNPAHPKAIQGNLLMDQALGLGTVPQAYLCCASSRCGTWVYCIHTPSRLTGALDGDITPWNNNLYAFLGELHQGFATIVNFPSTAFSLLERVPTRTTENILQNLPNVINGHDVPPPLPPNDAQVVETTTRYLMYLPAWYVPLLLDSRGYMINKYGIYYILLWLEIKISSTVKCSLTGFELPPWDS